MSGVMWKNGLSNEKDKNIILARNRVPIRGSIRNGQSRVEQAGFLGDETIIFVDVIPYKFVKQKWVRMYVYTFLMIYLL